MAAHIEKDDILALMFYFILRKQSYLANYQKRATRMWANGGLLRNLLLATILVQNVMVRHRPSKIRHPFPSVERDPSTTVFVPSAARRTDEVKICNEKKLSSRRSVSWCGILPVGFSDLYGDNGKENGNYHNGII